MSSCSLLPLCFDCARLRGVVPDVGWACDAFPDGVPTDILASVHDHHEPFDGDGGLTFKPKSEESEDDVAKLATDPPVSEAQRRAMWAAAKGHSTSGIPQSVGKEFAEADPGGKLPEKVGKDMSKSNWKVLRWLLDKFLAEESDEPEHQGEEGGEDFTSAGAMKAARTLRSRGLDEEDKDTSGADAASFEEIRDAVKAKADDPEALAAWIKDKTDPGWRGRDELSSAGAAAAARTLKSRGLDAAADTAIMDSPGGDRAEADESSVVRERAVRGTLAMDWAGRVGLRDRAELPIAEMAFDKGSARTYDKDGHLRVEKSHVTKANVCPYYGSEIPDADKLGLDPKKKYMLLRAADEIRKAAHTLRGKPILIKHTPVTSTDHKPDVVVGAVADDDPEFNDPYLDADLVFWPQDAIDAIESKAQSELSAGYHYRADMTPGTFKGVSYDGVMRDIAFNHLALVSEGRVGKDVMVADSADDLQWAALEAAIRALGVTENVVAN